MDYNNGKQIEAYVIETLKIGPKKTVKSFFTRVSSKSDIEDYIVLRMILRAFGRSNIHITRRQISTALKYSPEFKEDGTRLWIKELWDIYEYYRQGNRS